MNNKKERTREHILHESYNLFARDGLNQVTMKAVCEATGLSRGGLYSHFSSTREIFEAIMEELNDRNVMKFYDDIKHKVPAVTILTNALNLLEEEMCNSADSLSLALYEYSEYVGKDVINEYNKSGEEKWTSLIEYGISNGEFNNVNVKGIVSIILYAYQGIRLWCRIVDISPETVKSIIAYIKQELINEKRK